MALLALFDGPIALAGGTVLAATLPSAWCAAVVRLARGGASAVAVAVAVHLALLGAQAVCFAADYGLGWPAYRPALSMLAITAAVLAAGPAGALALVPRPLLAAIGLAGAVAFWRTASVAPAHVASRPIVAMTWNLQQGFDVSGQPNVARVAAVVRTAGTTVLGLVECDATRPLSGGRDPVAWLAAQLGMSCAIGPDPREATFGLAILSAHPIRSSQVLLRPSSGIHVGLLLATLEVDARPLRVAVTHLGGPSRHRLTQARAVAAALANVEGPLVLLGDFNAEPSSEPLAEITRAGLALLDTAGESTVFGGRERIDHILTKGLDCDLARVLDTGGVSDHHPVAVSMRTR
jgi:endonuclease/exonuclease/phosphatase family metal-dependent hydrolase